MADRAIETVCEVAAVHLFSEEVESAHHSVGSFGWAKAPLFCNPHQMQQVVAIWPLSERLLCHALGMKEGF